MNKNSVCLFVLILVSQCSFSNSSCSDIFGFFMDSSKTVFGEITLQPVEVVPKLVITISYTVQARLDNSNLGSIESPERVLDRYNRGETVRYRVYFPVVEPRPKVTEITLNGKTLCTGQGENLLERPQAGVPLRIPKTSLRDGAPREAAIDPPLGNPCLRVLDGGLRIFCWEYRLNACPSDLAEGTATR
ncbi:hypothetical protein PYW08_007932 [Mythimna loreyi]|uniref:Uncharacterized protein n=1 Tax=Mythimna loreyi TaxID=667449 RepID=A0ACC2QAX7_9NEOP|nr:hypothetical protein PYW08_007932 [Mythimna loreyi]